MDQYVHIWVNLTVNGWLSLFYAYCIGLAVVHLVTNSQLAAWDNLGRDPLKEHWKCVQRPGIGYISDLICSGRPIGLQFIPQLTHNPKQHGFMLICP